MRTFPGEAVDVLRGMFRRHSDRLFSGWFVVRESEESQSRRREVDLHDLHC